MRQIILKKVNVLGKPPVGYRVAYFKYDRPINVYAPIGIHLAVRFVRRVWEWSLRYRPSKLEKMHDEIASRHLREGRKIGEKIGREEALKEVEKMSGFGDIAKIVRRHFEEPNNNSQEVHDES